VIAPNGGRVCSHAGSTPALTTIGLAVLCTSLVLALALSVPRPKKMFASTLSTCRNLSALAVIAVLVLAVPAVQPQEVAPRFYAGNTSAASPTGSPDEDGTGEGDERFPPMFGFAIAVWATAIVGGFLVLTALAAFYLKRLACRAAEDAADGVDGHGAQSDSFCEAVVESGHVGCSADSVDVDRKVKGSGGSGAVAALTSGERVGRKL
jgi:hypothetical protein